MYHSEGPVCVSLSVLVCGRYVDYAAYPVKVVEAVTTAECLSYVDHPACPGAMFEVPVVIELMLARDYHALHSSCIVVSDDPEAGSVVSSLRPRTHCEAGCYTYVCVVVLNFHCVRTDIHVGFDPEKVADDATVTADMAVEVVLLWMCEWTLVVPC